MNRQLDTTLLRRGKEADRLAARGSEEPAAVYREWIRRLLSRRFYTAFELRHKLIEKGCEPALAEEISAEDAAESARREAVITEDHIRRGRESRLIGRSLILYELVKRGVRTDKITAALDRDYPVSEENDVALKLATRKLMAMNDLPPDKQSRRLAGMLERRGFSAEVIARIMNRHRLDKFSE